MTEKRNRGTEHYFSELPKSEAKLGMVHTRLRGEPFKFLTASSVFSKKQVDPGTRLLIEAMQLPDKGNVLDVGCGYGAVGIAAAASNPKLHVVMTDVNMRAVQLARRNIKINNVRNAEVRHGYLYEPIKDSAFNCVLSNPPVSAGMEIVKALITQAYWDHPRKPAAPKPHISRASSAPGTAIVAPHERLRSIRLSCLSWPCPRRQCR